MNDEVKVVLDIFAQIAAIPRGSGNEAALSAWLQEQAGARGWACRSDAVGNLVIRLPAAAGRETDPALILQGHMDMVCEKTPDSPHDFKRDPIRLAYAGDWLRADRTTLGADNGIGMALALAAAGFSAGMPPISHPPLELLFTVQEETGLVGASQLDAGLLDGKILINLDSEDEGVLITGCAGSARSDLILRLPVAPLPPDYAALEVEVSGLRGGHSGVDAAQQRLNALRLLAFVLHTALQAGEVRLAELKGGTASNVIPRQACAVIAWRSAGAAAVQAALEAQVSALRSAYAHLEPGLQVNLQSYPRRDLLALDAVGTQRAVSLLLALPNGATRRLAGAPEQVETSANLATAVLNGGAFEVVVSQRSAVSAQLEEINARCAAIGGLAGAHVSSRFMYPAWQPDPTSPLLARCIAAYQTLFGLAPRVDVIHAGLECGVIGSKKPGMDMISLGPTLRNPHSPDEALYLPSLEKVWKLLKVLVETF